MGESLTITELEARMRPGAYSGLGFLGLDESLEEVVRRDDKTLRDAGITHEQIADAIWRLIDEPFHQPHNSRALHIPDLYNPESIPHFDLDHLPGVEEGYLVGHHHQIFGVHSKGIQECPWGCEKHGGSYDFLILNRMTGEYFTGPSMIVGLIRDHHFFEGTGTPYRVDPLKAMRVLELTP